MNTTTLLARCRQGAYLEDTATDYTDAVILGQMTDQLQQIYEQPVVKSRQGYWFQKQNVAVTAGLGTYAIPLRAVMNGVERVQIAYDATLDFVDLPRVNELEAISYELGSGQTGQPARYITRGRNIQLLPTPDSSAYTIRFEFYCRPSRLVAPQASLSAGFVSAKDNVAKTVTILASIVSIDTSGTTSSMANAQYLIDVIGGPGVLVQDMADAGWHDFILTSQAANANAGGTVYTFTDPTVDLTTVQVGDYVRAANQSEWPQVSSDFHRTVADATAIKILTERRMTNPDLQAQCAADLDRFLDLLQPRAMNTPAQVISSPVSMYRGLRRAWPVKYP